MTAVRRRRLWATTSLALTAILLVAAANASSPTPRLVPNPGPTNSWPANVATP